MVDRNLVRELLLGVREGLLNDRLAHVMSKASAERQFAVELAALIEAHRRDVVTVPDGSEPARAGSAHLGLLVLPRGATEHRANGMLKAPESWPSGTLAIELRDVRLANGVDTPDGYDAALRELHWNLSERPASMPEGAKRADRIGLAIMTDGAWAGSPAKLEAERVAREVRIERWRPGPTGMLCIGSTSASIAYREWTGHVWVEAFVASPAGSAPPRDSLRTPPPESFGSGERETLAWYASHAADGRSVDGEGHAAAYVRVDAATLHAHRCDLYERLGVWGGTFEELRICLFVEERSWRERTCLEQGDGSSFELVPGVSQLLTELRTAWDRERATPI
jgi:hypothetical protein